MNLPTEWTNSGSSGIIIRVTREISVMLHHAIVQKRREYKRTGKSEKLLAEVL